jgi:3-deoxy-manno-octulosonate cytidylyltransferase (CMP-KDO synthetase)
MRNNPKTIGVIPARLDSQRLPGKVLLNIGSKPMVHWVYERARQSPLLGALIVATDSDRVHQYCAGHDIPVMMTRQHPSGSDRLHEVMERTDGDIYVNIQGDEPTIRVDHIELLLQPLLTGTCEVTTLKVAIDALTAQNPNVTKVITDNRNRALYFSRHPIPYDRESMESVDTHRRESMDTHRMKDMDTHRMKNMDTHQKEGLGNVGNVGVHKYKKHEMEKVGVHYFKHIGLYGYTRAALELFHSLPQSPLELAEKLEQLRYLENGISICVAETNYDTVGVDTEADLAQAAAVLIGDK